jgi:hypothetical protein
MASERMRIVPPEGPIRSDAIRNRSEPIRQEPYW